MIKSRKNVLELNKPYTFREKIRGSKNVEKAIYQTLKTVAEIGYNVAYIKWWVSESKKLNTSFAYYGVKNDRGDGLITRIDRLLN